MKETKDEWWMKYLFFIRNTCYKRHKIIWFGDHEVLKKTHYDTVEKFKHFFTVRGKISIL